MIMMTGKCEGYPMGGQVEPRVGEARDDGRQEGPLHGHHDPGGSQGEPKEKNGLLRVLGCHPFLHPGRRKGWDRFARVRI